MITANALLPKSKDIHAGMRPRFRTMTEEDVVGAVTKERE
jgi:hypothetical protein